MRVRSRIARVVAVLVSVLCSATAASAQLTAKQAQRQLAAASRAGLATYKQNLKALHAEVEANVDAFEVVLGGTPQTFHAVPFFNDLAAAQDELGLTTHLAFLAGFLGAAQGLFDLRGGGPSLNGIFPPGFYPGDGGAVDQHVALVLLQRDRFYAKIAKRLARTRKLAEKAGLGLTVVLWRSSGIPGATWSDVGGSSSTGRRPLTLDTLVGASRLANAGDGVLAIGGQADDESGTVTLRIVGKGGTDLTDTVEPDPATERYAVTSSADFAMTPLPEGTFYVTAHQMGPLEEATIGIR